MNQSCYHKKTKSETATKNVVKKSRVFVKKQYQGCFDYSFPTELRSSKNAISQLCLKALYARKNEHTYSYVPEEKN